MALQEFAGRRLARVITGRLGPHVEDARAQIGRLGVPLVRALIDSLVADRLVAATWPSFLVLCLIVAVHLGALAFPNPERDRLVVGLIVLGALLYSVISIVRAIPALWPHARLWFVTRLGPVAHTRLLIYQVVHDTYRGLSSSAEGVLAATIREVQHQTGTEPAILAFEIADEIAPVIVRHAARRLALLAVPLATAIAYYRFAVYPDLIARYTDVGPWTVAAYPLAALADAVAGTHLRAALRGA